MKSELIIHYSWNFDESGIPALFNRTFDDKTFRDRVKNQLSVLKKRVSTQFPKEVQATIDDLQGVRETVLELFKELKTRTTNLFAVDLTDLFTRITGPVRPDFSEVIETGSISPSESNEELRKVFDKNVKEIIERETTMRPSWLLAFKDPIHYKVLYIATLVTLKLFISEQLLKRLKEDLAKGTSLLLKRVPLGEALQSFELPTFRLELGDYSYTLTFAMDQVSEVKNIKPGDILVLTSVPRYLNVFYRNFNREELKKTENPKIVLVVESVTQTYSEVPTLRVTATNFTYFFKPVLISPRPILGQFEEGLEVSYMNFTVFASNFSGLSAIQIFDRVLKSYLYVRSDIVEKSTESEPLTATFYSLTLDTIESHITNEALSNELKPLVEQKLEFELRRRLASFVPQDQLQLLSTELLKAKPEDVKTILDKHLMTTVTFNISLFVLLLYTYVRQLHYTPIIAVADGGRLRLENVTLASSFSLFYVTDFKTVKDVLSSIRSFFYEIFVDYPDILVLKPFYYNLQPACVIDNIQEEFIESTSDTEPAKLSISQLSSFSWTINDDFKANRFDTQMLLWFQKSPLPVHGGFFTDLFNLLISGLHPSAPTSHTLALTPELAAKVAVFQWMMSYLNSRTTNFSIPLSTVTTTKFLPILPLGHTIALHISDVTDSDYLVTYLSSIRWKVETIVSAEYTGTVTRPATITYV